MGNDFEDNKSCWDALRKECPLLYPSEIEFECGPGWYNLIFDLSRKIETILEREQAFRCSYEYKEHWPTKKYAVHVKEKYGTMRFYMSSETWEISELIEDAEALSSQTCEMCGNWAKMRGHEFMYVRCDECDKECG
jgi:hypothetical protein